jgi:hypothetical protein
VLGGHQEAVVAREREVMHMALADRQLRDQSPGPGVPDAHRPGRVPEQPAGEERAGGGEGAVTGRREEGVCLIDAGEDRLFDDLAGGRGVEELALVGQGDERLAVAAEGEAAGRGLQPGERPAGVGGEDNEPGVEFGDSEALAVGREDERAPEPLRERQGLQPRAADRVPQAGLLRAVVREGDEAVAAGQEGRAGVRAVVEAVGP